MSGDPKSLIAAKFLDSFLREIVLDTAIHTHTRIKRARSICHLCGVRCQSHTPAAEQSPLTSTLDSTPSRSGTPVPGAASGSKPDYYSHNPLFECLVCSRQVSSNRYATHLAKCMGMGNKGGRKGAARNAKATSLTNGKSGSGTPRYSSDADDDGFAKRKNGVANNGKRANSPLSASPLANARMNKRIKTSSPTPPPAESGLNRTFSSQTFAPSGLSTVVSGSPLNPNNTNGTNGVSKKRKRLIDDDDDDEGDSYHDPSDGESNEEEGEISDDDVALAASSAPPNTKVKIPIRSTPTGSKPKTFVVADDSDDSDDNLAGRRAQSISDDDDDGDDDDDDDDVQVTRVTHSHNGDKKKKPTTGSGLQRERGSDGEFIDVESASEQSDADSF